MTATSGKLLPVGARHARVFALNTSYLPAATSPTVPYEGLELYGPRSLELNTPDARLISHSGKDTVLNQDALPPLEAPSAQLKIARLDFDVQAAVTGISVVTIGESKWIGHNTSKDGFEPIMGLVTTQQGLNEDGNRVWRTLVYPRMTIKIMPNGMNDNPSEHNLRIIPRKGSAYLWGPAFVVGTEGYTRSFYQEGDTQYFFWQAFWKADGTATKFSFDAARPAVSTAKINIVTINGVADATVTKAVDGVTPTTKPSANDIVGCMYEVANPEED